MSWKLPHERLREWADRAEDGYDCPSTYMTTCMLESGEVNHESRFDTEEVAAFRKLADEIERYYIPRPRFEDGEPVQFGDEPEWLETVDEMTFYQGGSAAIGHDGNTFWVRPGERVKRPAPKVLDADGVPIEVGDVVWRLRDSTKWQVIEMQDTEPRVTVRQLDVGNHVVGGCFLAADFSHREPDSLERLRNDMAAYSSDTAEPGSILEDVLDGWMERLTALIERGAE